MREPPAPSPDGLAARPSPGRPSRRLPFLLIGLIGLIGLVFGLGVGRSPVDATLPELTAQPAVMAGTQVFVFGEGFAPRAQVELAWRDLERDIPHVRADEAGRFEAAVTVPPDTPPGVYTLVAIELGDASNDLRHVEVSIRVVGEDALGTTEDPDQADHAGHTGSDPSSGPELAVVPVPPSSTAEASSDPHADHAAADDQAPPAASAPGDDHGHGSVPPPSATTAPSHPPAHAPSAGNPVSCTGWPEPRVFLEIHAWWEGPPLAAGHIAHLHAGTCFPLGQTMSGQVIFDTRIVMHDNPGHLFRYETALFTGGQGQDSLSVVGLDRRCPSTCEFWVRTVIDTSGANDGWHEVRVKPRVEFSDGSVLLTSAGWPLITANGNPPGGSLDASDGAPDIVGRGWYEDHGYQNPVLRSVDAVLPGRAISGVWQPTLRLDAGSDGSTPTFSAAYLNPDFHHNDEDSNGGGIVLGQWAGPFRGTIAIDTRTLANGQYTLVLRVEDRAGGTGLTALQYIPIVVSN